MIWERIKEIPGIILEWKALLLLIVGGVAGYSGNEVQRHYYPAQAVESLSCPEIPKPVVTPTIQECPPVGPQKAPEVIVNPQCKVEINSSFFSQLMDDHEREHHE